jgi:large-conductance mechanosensitive channel
MIKDPYDILFNFTSFSHFLKENNVIATSIAAVLSDKINEVTSVFVSEMIIPFINIENNKLDKIRKYEIFIGGTLLKVGEVFYSFIKFVILFFIIFIISEIFKKFNMF